MFKRATWLGVGFTLGVGTTVAAARKARRQIERYRPSALTQRATDSIRDGAISLRDQLAAAIDDGRAAAREREAQLRGEPVRGEPVHGEPVHGEPVHGEPVHGEPVRGGGRAQTPSTRPAPTPDAGDFTAN